MADGHSVSIDNPDSFINTVIPKTMAGHFLFDGEHAEVFLGEENRRGIRKAVQDILGCNLIETAIEDLEETAAYYRRQMPKAKATDQIEVLSNEIDRLTEQLKSGREALDGLKGQDILEMEECICGTELKKGSTEYEKVRSLLQKAANKTLRSRLSSVRSTLKELKREFGLSQLG